jgi:phosphoglycolate phosphatase
MLTIAFDLDGTLVDTAPDLIDALNHALTQHGLSSVPFAAARPSIGGGARAMIENALATKGRESAPADVDRLYTAFIAHYAEHVADRSRPFPHVEATLDALAGQGYRLAVCTNKLEWLSKRLLVKLHLTDRFAAICGQDTFGVQKPDPKMFRLTVERAGGEPKRAIMVGDSVTDIRTARAARVPVVAVDFGYTDIPIASLHPDRMISSFAQLPPVIGDLTTAKT